jgi:hypothetical protein
MSKDQDLYFDRFPPNKDYDDNLELEGIQDSELDPTTMEIAEAIRQKVTEKKLKQEGKLLQKELKQEGELDPGTMAIAEAAKYEAIMEKLEVLKKPLAGLDKPLTENKK